MHAQEVMQEVLAPQEHASRLKKWKYRVLAVYPQEHSQRKKLKMEPQEVTNLTASRKKVQEVAACLPALSF